MVNVRECLINEQTLKARNLYESYKIGGLQLENYLEVSRDYIQELEDKYPGIRTSLRERVNNQE